MSKNYQNEFGRSMVEMQGVLAVMGVLSVGGITGYTTAMNQYRANEAINRTMALAVMLSAQRLVNPNATLSESDLGSGLSVGNDTDKIVLTLSNIDEKVRSRIENMGLKNATVSSGENGALTFTFNNDLSERDSGTNSGSNQQQDDPCAGFTATTCTTACTNNNGTAVYTYAEEGTSCDANNNSACDGNGTCNQCPAYALAKLAFVNYSGPANSEESRLTNVQGCYCYPDLTFASGYCAPSGGEIN